MNNFIVYKHTSPNGKVYIGITSQAPNRRWRNGDGYKRNVHFYKAIKKYGWENFEHTIIACGLTQADAEELEISLIKEYDSTDCRKGYNLDNGGNYTGKRSEQTKQKLREIGKATATRYWLGKKLTPEHIKHAVENRTYTYGAENPRSKAVYCDGVVYGCTRECAEQYGVTCGTIADYCSGGKKMPEKWAKLNLHYVNK